MKQKIINVTMAVLMITSLFAGFAGTAAATTDGDTSAGEEALQQCGDNLSLAGAIIPLYGGYQCVSGAFTPADYDSTSELENEAWNSAISIQDAVETRGETYDNWEDLAQTNALQQAEEPVIESHYAEEDEGQARSAGQETLRDYYAAQQERAYTHRNDVISRAYSVSKNTYAADDLDHGSLALLEWQANPTGFDPIPTSVTSNSELIYEERTLYNGDTMDVIVAITDIDYSDTDAEDHKLAFDYDYIDDNVADPSPENDYENRYYPVVLSYDGNDWDDESFGDKMEMIANDPYGDDEREFNPMPRHLDRLDDVENEFEESQSELETMVGDLYDTHTAGTIDPDEYVSAATLTNEYGQEDSHYSYAAAKATSLGLNTDLSSQQTVTVDGEEYEGMVLTSDQGEDLADAEANTYIDRDGSILDFTADADEPATDTITFTDDYTPVSVDGAASDGISISESSVVIEEDALIRDHVLMTVEYADSEGDTVEDTVVMYASDSSADDGIPQGYTVGDSYTVDDSSAMLAYQSGETAETMSLDEGSEFTIDSATSATTGDDMDTVEYADGGQRTFTDTSNIQEEYDRQQSIQDAVEQRTDNDAAGGGGLGDVQSGIIGFIGGVGIVFAFGVVVLILFLVGRITSVA